MDVVNHWIEVCTNFIEKGGPILGFFLIFLESFLPVLPLGVFVALNVNAFGFLFGIIISWIATCLGCLFSYFVFNHISTKWLKKYLQKKKMKKVEDAIEKFQSIPFPHLTVIITLPFTPAFLVNILAGLVRMKEEKFISALFIGKIFMITFWAYIGKSFIESMTDIKAIIFISILLLLAYFLSKLVGKRMNIE